ncbi:MAG: hypothetical protein FJW36_11480 [Acidobacteria bacterium]|nr:hypothetical protein [Acidobacteriota bacterium]
MTDPIQIWKSQPINQQYLAVLALHQKARNLQANTRRQLTISLAGPVISGLFYAYINLTFPTLNQPFLLGALM